VKKGKKKRRSLVSTAAVVAGLAAMAANAPDTVAAKKPIRPVPGKAKALKTLDTQPKPIKPKGGSPLGYK